MTAKQLLPLISWSVHQGLACVRKVVRPQLGLVQETPYSWGQISLLRAHPAKGRGSSRVTLAANTLLAVLGNSLHRLFLLSIFIAGFSGCIVGPGQLVPSTKASDLGWCWGIAILYTIRNSLILLRNSKPPLTTVWFGIISGNASHQF